MSENHEKIRISQVLAGALAAVTAAVLGSTMGVAGTVVGAGAASVVSTVGGALYLRSIQRTGQGVRSVRNLVVTRAGSTTVTVVEKSEVPAKPEDSAESADGPEEGEKQPPPARRIGWRAVVVGSVLAFVLGMAVITGVEWLRGEPLSGGEGTTIGEVVRTQPDGGDEREHAPAPATRESTSPPSTGGSIGTFTPTGQPTSVDQDPSDSSGSTTPQTTLETAAGDEPMGTVVPPSGGAG
jgi:hypothetical protein